jgi:hypothetical protein
MPLAIDRNEKMWTARNLNDLYARFDNKCARTLDGKTPYAVGVTQLRNDGSNLPKGVEYEYCIDPATSFYVFGSTPTQTQIEHELSFLETKYQDPAGGQVYVDRYVDVFDATDCNVEWIQKSFELHKRTVDGIEYDVHLGWDDWDSGYLSYVRSYFSAAGSTPSLPPGRIHNHKTAVAEIKIEGLLTFKILNSYKRFDCWRVHNFGSKDLTVFLQLPDGSAERKTVPAMGCRSFRRRADGTWLSTWRDGTPCVYFFPYVAGDVPYFAGGPPMYGQLESLSVCMERSAKANNIANPFILLQWMRIMGAWVDAAFAHDIRLVYPEYSDPADSNTAIGDAIFTWGRARVQIYDVTSGGTYRDFIKVFTGVTSFLETLDDIGINVVVDGTDLSMFSKTPNAAVRIYPIDCNVFFQENQPFWQINPTTTYISIKYPAYYYTQDVSSPQIATVWQPNNVPTWMEKMRDLRARIAVEEGFIVSYNPNVQVEIPEEKVGIVKLSPIGLTVRVATTGGIQQYDANALSEATNYERVANVMELRTELRPTGFGVGIYSNTPYISVTKTYILAQPSNYNGMYGNIFPQISTQAGGLYPYAAVNCAYVPSGGPWGFSSSVYDYDLERVFSSNGIPPSPITVFGSDFWINKWGGKGGVDASVRILGKPNKTIQDNGVADDVFRDKNNAAMACLAPWFPQVSVTTTEQAYLADIRWKPAIYFDLEYEQNIANKIGPLYHKIPKSAFLWNLLESHVNGWNRSIPMAHGDSWCPIRKFNAAGVIVPSTMGDVLNKDLTLTCLDPSEGPCFFISGNQYYDFLANGLQAKELYDTAIMQTYWVISQSVLATYCRSKGFNSFNFDCSNAVLTGAGGLVTAATTWRPMRSYGFGETTQSASYEDAMVGPLYRDIRYVDLDVA